VRSRYKFYKWLKISHGSRTLVNGHLRSIALHVVREPANSHVTEFSLRADAGVQVQKPLGICHGSRRKSKNHDKFIDTTDRVIASTLRRVMLSLLTICPLFFCQVSQRSIFASSFKSGGLSISLCGF
jgi:hypothetical protein